jgi:putative PIN family toxin of toxin-antitoxin system
MNVRRVVLDTNILVSALLSPQGNPAKIYKMFMSGVLTLVFNTEIFAEYQDVLSRPHLKIPSEEMEMVLAAIRQHGEQVFPTPSTHIMRDEDDRVFYDVAKLADAYLITGNTKHYPAEQFILTPAAFIEL